MKITYIVLLFALIFGACGREKSTNKAHDLENNSEQDSSFWVPLPAGDSVKYIRSTNRIFNQGKDSVMFIHYMTDLYKINEDAKNPKFIKQSLELLNLLAQAPIGLPDTLYLQAMGMKSEGIIKKSTNFNVLATNNGSEWTVNVDETWKSLKDFENLSNKQKFK